VPEHSMPITVEENQSHALLSRALVRANLVGVEMPGIDWPVEESLDELARLANDDPKALTSRSSWCRIEHMYEIETLAVLEPGEEKTPEQELTDDLLALIASFSGRLYGMRSRKQKALVDCAKQVLAEQEE